MSSCPRSSAIRLAFIGDIALGEGPSSAGLGVSRFLEAPLYHQWQNYLASLSADFVVGNFEGTVSDLSQYPEGHIMHSSMRVDTESAGPLGTAGITHVSLANNHSNDHGTKALAESLSFLRSEGIVAMEHFWPTGSAYEVQGDGFTIGIIALNFVDKSMGRSDASIAIRANEIPDLIARIKEQRHRFDHLVVTIHWGENYGLWPNAMQLNLARELVSAGASAVIGHHPHNIQSVREIDGAPVVFSLGSFCFENKSPFTRLGQIVALHCTRDSVSIVDHRYISVGNDYRVREELSWIQRRMVGLAGTRPSRALNFVFVRTVRIWILVVSLFRTVRAGKLGQYARWARHRYANTNS